MKTNFTIKNFRVFDENGVDIDLAPITILTGKNSAGKSSIVKAISLLNSFLLQIRRDKENKNPIVFSKYKLEFNKVFDGALGNFNFVRHRGSDQPAITFEYTTYSTMLFRDVKVSFTFKDEDEGKDEKYLHNGLLSEFKVMTTEGDMIYSSTDYNFHFNLNIIKESFCDFVMGEFYANVFIGSIYQKDASRKERKEQCMVAKNEFDKLDEMIRKNINRYMRNPFAYEEPIIQKGSYKDVELVSTGSQIFGFSVIYELLATLSNEDVLSYVDEILDNDDKIDDNEKYVIKQFVKNILATGKNLSDYWKEREETFLCSVTEDCSVLKLRQESIVFPNSNILNVGQNGHLTFRFYQKNGNDNTDKEDVLNKWSESLMVDFIEARYEFVLLDLAYKRWKQRKDSSQILEKHNSFDNDDEEGGLFEHPAYRMLCEYASRAVENLLFPVWSEHLINISSSRALPKRLYTPNADNDFYKVLNNYLIALSEYETYQNHYRSQNKNNYVPKTFLNRWIGHEGFELGKTISVESIMGSAIVVKLIKDDGTEAFLTDEGHGLTQLVSILLSIETAILQARGVKYKNYVDQSALDGLNTTEFYYEQQTIAVEEPEIHLHPAFQSLLADMFVSASEYNIHFIVETHSEYLIRKSQVLVAEREFLDEADLNRNNPFKVYYISNDVLKCYEMKYKISGRFSNKFGPGFFDEAGKSNLITLRKEKELNL